MITGASGEFGTEIAHALVRAGTKVVLVGRGHGRLRTLAEKLGDAFGEGCNDVVLAA